MANITYNGTNWDNHLGSATIGATNVNILTTGITSLGVTAPNLVNKATGVWIGIASSTNSPNNITVELLESGVVKATATINQADHVVGYNYVRFATPYTFATLTASAYTIRLKTTSTNSGSVRAVTAGNLWYQLTYDSAVAIGGSDNTWIGGFLDSGLTTKKYIYTGTSGSWGTGTNPSWASTSMWDMDSPIIIGNGGIFEFDTTADTTLTVAGAVVVYKGGLFDMRPGSAYTNTLIFNQGGSDGRFGIISPSTGGQILTTGAVVSVAAQYASGTGTAANPLITSAAHGFVVGQELIIPGLTYSTNQVRYVKTVPTSTQLVLSTTIGGAEAAITNTPAVDSWIANMTRNSIIKSTTTTHGHWIYNSNANTTPLSDFKWTRHEYANCASGKGLNFNGGSNTVTDGNDADFTGTVVYNNSATGRTSITWSGKAPQTVTDIILYNPKGVNYSAQSGLVFLNYNKIANRVYQYAEPSSTTNAGGVSFGTASVSNKVDNFHSYGANANNGSLGYALGFYGVFNTVTNSTINSARTTGIRANSAQSMNILNSSFGTIGTNTIDLTLDSSTLNTMLFTNCNFGSATLISGYTSGLDGTEIKYHKYQQTAHKHRWYTNTGSARSTGAGLEDTTVKTAGSINVVLLPENNTTGFAWEFNVLAPASSLSFINGYLQKNAAFGTSVAKVELWLPGSDTSSTADATFTADNTTGSYQAFNTYKLYSGTAPGLSTVRVTAISATASAYLYVSDLFNSVGALNLWDKGKPAKQVAITDFSSVPAAVWSFPDSNTVASTMGKRQVDAADDADTAANK